MAMCLIRKEFRFESAHRLPNHKADDGSPGKCSRPHGHSYRLIVTVGGQISEDDPSSSDFGFVMDYADLSKIVKTFIVNKWDHRDLNKILPFRTTAENMAQYVFGTLIERSIPVVEVELFETATSSAVVDQVLFDTSYFEKLVGGELRPTDDE